MYFPVLIALLYGRVTCGLQNNITGWQEPRIRLYCTNYDDREIQKDQRLRQVIAGKTGPTGPPGKVNYTAVNGTIKNYVKEISRHELSSMRLAVEGNSEEIQNLTEISGRNLSKVRLEVEGNREGIQNLTETSGRNLSDIRLEVDGNREGIKNLTDASDQTQRQLESCRSRVSRLESKIYTLQRTFNLVGDILWYDDKRYIALISNYANKEKAKSMCSSLGGYLANIYSSSHMNSVMKYIRQNKLGGSEFRDFHLGMTYDPNTSYKPLRSRYEWSGYYVSSYSWYPDYPYNDDSSYTNMFIRVNRNPSSTYQYLFNYPDDNQNVLCEI